jgi:beta-lactamase class A
MSGGKHSARGHAGGPAPGKRVRARVVPVALGVCLAAGAGLLVSLMIGGSGGSGGHPAAAAPAASTGRASPSRRPQARGTPSPKPQLHRDPFAAAATSFLATRAGRAMAAVYDIDTGQTWSLGAGQPEAEASIVKLDILETLLAEHRDNGTGLPAGDRSLAQLMIEDSDNDAATSLWYAAGGTSGIRSFNTAAGLADTSPSPCVVCAGFPWPGWGLTTTTATDQISLLRQLIEPGALLTSADRGYALSLMENVTPSQRWGITGGVPPRVTVALKNGWLPLNDSDTDWQINSIGLVSGLGRDYLIAVLTTGNPTEQYGIDTISGLAGIIWANMG